MNAEDRNSLQRYFFMGFLLAVSVLVLFIFLPFLEVLVLSTIFGVVLYPLQSKLSKLFGGKNGVSAFIVVVLFTVLVIAPFVFLFSQLINESKDVYIKLTNNQSVDYIQKITEIVEKPIQRFYPSFSIDISGIASLGADWITEHLSSIFSKVLSVFTGVILIFISLFFFLRDGERFRNILIDLSPLNDRYDEQIFTKIKNTITVTVKGVLLVSIAQGILSGIGMFIFGIPNPTLWGSISAIASLVPGLGTMIVFIPAILYMLFLGNIGAVIGLLLWGILIVGLIDNLLTPYLYSRGTEIHSLIMLFSVLGGLIAFGPIGFIFGPIIIALFFSLIDIYQNLILKKDSL